MDIKDKELVKTKAPIAKVRPNPFRNFEINPIRNDHVEKLLASIEDIGMWSGLPARKIPETTPAEYQIACGHHRLEAIKRAELSQVSIDIRPYTDEQMIRIMVEENMTQRGNENAGTVLDSVAAVIVQIVKESNLGDNCTPNHNESRLLNGEGIGHKAICKKQPTISQRNARDAINILKASGTYADLIENGRAPEKVVKLYRSDEIEAIPNALKAVTMFQKASHGRTFIDTVKAHQNTCDRSEEEYINCANSILEQDKSITLGRIERAVLDYFEVEKSKVPAPPSDGDQNYKESEVNADKQELKKEPCNLDTAPEPTDNKPEGSIDTTPVPSEKESPAAESTSSYQEAFQQLQLAISKHMHDGWKAVTKSSTLSSLKKLTVEICEDQSVEGDIPPAERLGDTIIDLLESMDDQNGRERDKALKDIRDECNRRLKGTVSSSDIPIDLAA